MRAQTEPGEHGFARLGTAVAKFWISKRCPVVVNEALECLGGNGYVEESILPRLYREAPLNSIWEGSGNVICLDILRAMHKEPDAVESVLGEIRLARGADTRLDAFAASIENDLRRMPAEIEARRLAERLALALQGSLLARHSIPAVADAFCATRLAGDGFRCFGTLPPQVDFRADHRPGVLIGAATIVQHVVFVHVGVADFQRVPFAAEDFETQRSIQPTRRRLIDAHGEQDLLQIGLQSRLAAAVLKSTAGRLRAAR